jgi:guanosine-3',5'-bis(diphosphate) 3'-pyrophosphohydrolase
MFDDELGSSLVGLPPRERTLVKRAYEFAREAHKGQKRMSGEDQLVHCIEVARILADLKMDAATIAAGLLHDVVEDTTVTGTELRDEFGKEIAGLVSGVTKMDRVSLDTERAPKGKPRDREAEYLRQTLLTMDVDIRVVLIKLADRLHNMRTLSHLPHDRQQRMARETMDIFAPLASRLGIWQFKWELEDLAFRYLDPERYRGIAKSIDERRIHRDEFINKVVEDLKAKLAEEKLTAEVSGRPKHIYSIWRKMERKDIPYDQVLDVQGVRVVVPDIATCYQVLGIIHQIWRPIAGTFDDYIAMPKDNFYQSLHTAVILPGNRTLEVQIRTPEMHANAEYGVAAHWLYKETGKPHDDAFDRRLKHLRELMEVGRNVEDANEFLEIMQSDVFRDRVYVFTPRGDIIDLPTGSTPIDFAYHIHTDIGDRCRGARINGKLSSLDSTLQVGDRVEILTAKHGGPSRDWLNPSLGYVKTKRAISKIRQWFRKQDREKMIGMGREVLDRELKRLGLEKMSHDQVAALFGFETSEELLAQIGFGDVHPQQIATKVLEIDKRNSSDALEWEKDTVTPAPRLSPHGIRVQGTGGLLTTLARCCNPVQGDEIVGYITRGRGVTVHRQDCRNVLNQVEHERLIAVEWGDTVDDRYSVSVVINAYDREGLVRDIGAAVADEHINMRDVSIRTHNHIATFSLTMEVASAAQLSRVLSKIEHLPNVLEARRRSA